MSSLTRVGGTLQRWDDQLRRVLGPTRLDVQLEQLRSQDEPDPELVDLIRRAWEVGASIDLSGIGYGPQHFKKGVAQKPSSYYHFLAGLVRLKGFRRILEFGTHHAGSISAMLRAAETQSDVKLVTVDIADAGKTPPGVVGIIGDANSDEVVQRIVLEFGAEPIDFLFIDADHRFMPTLASFGVFTSLLRPKYVALDDIVLSKSMRAMWNVLCASYRRDAVNCVDVEPGVRPRSCGFGLIRLRDDALG